MTATVARVARPRGELTDGQKRHLDLAREDADRAQRQYRAAVVAVLNKGASFAEVSQATGLSTNTLQRWKRESA